MFLVGLYILPRSNLEVYDVVYLFPRDDIASNKGWGYPIIVWEGVDTEYLSKD